MASETTVPETGETGLPPRATETTPAEMRPPADQDQDRHDRQGSAILGVVFLAGLALGVTNWVDIAKAVGFTAHWAVSVPKTQITTTWYVGGVALGFWVAWLLPVAVDGLALYAIREWMRAKPGSELWRWARFITLSVVSVSWVSQAIYRGFEDGKVNLFNLGMGGIPALSIAASAHLGALRNRSAQQEAEEAAWRAGEAARKAAEKARKTSAKKTTPPTVETTEQDQPQPVLKDQAPKSPRRAKTGPQRDQPMVLLSDGDREELARVKGRYKDRLPGRNDLVRDGIFANRASRICRYLAAEGWPPRRVSRGREPGGDKEEVQTV